LYDIRLANGGGPFLQPRSPHGAHTAQLLAVCFLDNLSFAVRIDSTLSTVSRRF